MFKGIKGATLTEVIVIIAILGIIITPVATLLNTGYRDYFVEDDTRVAQQLAREILYGDGAGIHGVIEELRRNDNKDIAVYTGADVQGENADGDTLFIKNDIVYSYSASNKSLHKKSSISYANDNSNKIYDNVTGFKVRKESTGLENKVISIEIGVKVGKGREIKLSSSYRIKASDSIDN